MPDAPFCIMKRPPEPTHLATAAWRGQGFGAAKRNKCLQKEPDGPGQQVAGQRRGQPPHRAGKRRERAAPDAQHSHFTGNYKPASGILQHNQKYAGASTAQ